MDRRRGDAEQLLPLWAVGEAEFIQHVEDLRGTSVPRCRRRVAGSVSLALAACALAALGGGWRGSGGGGRVGADVGSSVALDAYADALAPTAYGAARGGLAGGEPAAYGAAAVSPRLTGEAEGPLPSAADGSRGADGSPEGSPEVSPGAALGQQGGAPTSDAQAEALLESMLSQAQASLGGGGGSAAAGGGAGRESDWSAAAEAAAAAQWAQAQTTAGPSAGAGAAGAVAADAVPTTEATSSVTTTVITSQTATQTTTTASATQTTKTDTTTLAKCGLVEPAIDYPGNDLRAVKDVLSAELCCNECSLDTDCVAWVWGEKRGEVFSDMCFLKGGHPRGQITRVPNPDVVSGQPTQAGRFIPTLNRTSGQSLFCFSLMLPNSYESDLLAYQFEKAGGVFGCDEYAIYSNVSAEVALGCSTLKVDMDLHSEMGGEFGTALNTGVFLSVWQSVVGAGRYKFHDWTVKVDPDSVFFAPRLRLLVKSYAEVPGGLYLNNCKYGLHGPLEVFSTNAVTAWDGAQERCEKHFWELCSGDCNWGEDMFIDQCLNYTGVQRKDDFNQLLEDHCSPPDGWDECSDPLVVAFHPFKTVEKQKHCVNNAIGSSP